MTFVKCLKIFHRPLRRQAALMATETEKEALHLSQFPLTIILSIMVRVKTVMEFHETSVKS